jgi:hypothetical protein
MPRRQKTEEEKALEQQVAALIKNIKGSDEPKVDVNRALNLFKRAQVLTAQAIAILEGTEAEEQLDPNKKKAGRPRKIKENDLFDSIPAGEAVKVKPEPSVSKK